MNIDTIMNSPEVVRAIESGYIVESGLREYLEKHNTPEEWHVAVDMLGAVCACARIAGHLSDLTDIDPSIIQPNAPIDENRRRWREE